MTTHSNNESEGRNTGEHSRRSLLLGGLGLSLALAAPFGGIEAAHAADRGKVLVILSSASELELKGGKKYHTGFYLDELSIPLRKIVEAGYAPVFANPEGNAAAFDPVSNDKMFFGNDDNARAEAIRFIDSFAEFKKPKTLAAVLKEGTSGYVGIFIPGGHAPMQDLIQNKTLGDILKTFHTTGRPTGVICHGPTALLSTVSDPVAYRNAMVAGDIFTASKIAADWPYAGYRVTVFATGEEQIIEGPGKQLGGSVLFYAADALAQAGAHVDRIAAFQPNVIDDRELVSGQQPFSSDVFGDAFVAKLLASASR
jgi:putative intracellular protease/amidase